MTRALVLAAILLAGCPMLALPRGASRPPLGRDLRAIDAVIAAGTARGITSSTCDDERRDRLVVIDADNETMMRIAGYCARGSDVCASTDALPEQEKFDARARFGCYLGACAGGVTFRVADDVWPVSLTRSRGELYISIYVEPPVRTDLLLHEATHWFLGCSSGDADPLHLRAYAWGAGGIEASAREALR